MLQCTTIPTPRRTTGVVACMPQPRNASPRVTPRVNLTGGNRSGLTGNRSNRSGPVPVPTGSQPVQIQILNLNSKK